ncbi:MAG: sialate O-acetylesterase, partial [Verrucomicrobiota bacterium]
MNRLTSAILFGTFVISSCWAEEPLLTFVLAGQSNMVGKRCRYVELSPDLQMANEQAHFFNAERKEWIPLEPGQTEPAGFGPEIAFGKKMTELLGQPIGIIKYSRGGTNLAKQWNPDSPNSLYAQLKAQVDTARKTRDIRVVGMLWVQGGADAKDEEMSQKYAENLRGLIERSREDFGNAEMVFLSGRIPVKDSKTKPHWKLVRAAQENLEIADYAWVNCDDIRVGPDKVHYDSAGMTQLGERQATMMAARLTEKLAGTRMFDGDPGKIDFSKLPRVAAEHSVISDVRDRAGTWVHQHAYLAHHGNRYWAMWSDGPGVPRKGASAEEHRNKVPGHDNPDTRVSFATSEDGVNWSKPATLSGPPRIEGFGWIARGFWVRDQQLLALASHFNAPAYPGEGLSLEAFLWNESEQKWDAHGTVFDDTLNNFPHERQSQTGATSGMGGGQGKSIKDVAKEYVGVDA